jgi:hypothetical protein
VRADCVATKPMPSKDSGRIFGTGSFVAPSFAASILLAPASLIFAVRSEG